MSEIYVATVRKSATRRGNSGQAPRVERGQERSNRTRPGWITRAVSSAAAARPITRPARGL